MKDYRSIIRRGIIHHLALRLSLIPAINPIAIFIARWFLPSHLRHRVPVLDQVARLRLPGGDIILRNTDRCQVAKEVFWQDGLLASSADNLALSLAVSLSKQADVFLDIGSYTGLFSLAVAKANSNLTVHAYEILPENYLYLCQNIFANNLVARIEPHLVGIGSERSSCSAPYSFGSGVLPSAVAIDSHAVDGITVPIAPLDVLFASFSGRMVWKIDVEGFEWGVFQGAVNLIRCTRPDIICEVLVNAPQVSMVEDFLLGHEYYMYHIKNNGLHLKEKLVPSVDGRDWLFTVQSPDQLALQGWPIASGFQAE